MHVVVGTRSLPLLRQVVLLLVHRFPSKPLGARRADRAPPPRLLLAPNLRVLHNRLAEHRAAYAHIQQRADVQHMRAQMDVRPALAGACKTWVCLALVPRIECDAVHRQHNVRCCRLVAFLWKDAPLRLLVVLNVLGVDDLLQFEAMCEA